MAISDSLSKRIERDVRGSQETAIEVQVKNSLSEIKNKFKYAESYLSTLYDSGFKAYLKSKVFNNIENLPKEILAINNIKQRLIKQGLEAKRSAEHSPNFITRNVIYPICGISKDISKNNKIENIIKGVIDEVMAIPDMVIQIFKNPAEFAKSLRKLIKNPKDLWNGLKQAYGDAFTQWLATPESQYRTGRSATLIVLTFLPGGAAKFGLNIAGLRAVTKGVSKVTTKAPLKNVARTTGKSAAKKMEQGVKSVTKKTEQGLKNQKGSTIMYRELNGGAKNYAQRLVERNSVKITNETQAATKAGRVAEVPAKTPGTFKRGVDKVVRFGDKVPVMKQIDGITRWTFKKSDRGTEAIVKKLHPKFYEKLAKQEASLQKIKASAKSAARDLNVLVAEVEKITRIKTQLEISVAGIKKSLAKNPNNSYYMQRLGKTEEMLSYVSKKLKEAKKLESNLRTKLKNANEKY